MLIVVADPTFLPGRPLPMPDTSYELVGRVVFLILWKHKAGPIQRTSIIGSPSDVLEAGSGLHLANVTAYGTFLPKETETQTTYVSLRYVGMHNTHPTLDVAIEVSNENEWCKIMRARMRIR